MKRSKHKLSHDVNFTANMGNLVPCGIVDVLPGDVFRHDTSMLIRMSPLNNPVMTPVHATIHHWYVPLRLIWAEFEDFITGGEDGLAQPVFPTTDAPEEGWPVGSLADYFGIVPLQPVTDVSVLPFRAYNLIWNENYRDEQLQTPVTITKASGPDTTTSQDLLNACWRKDPFTIARPEPQLGPDVYLPLGTSAPVVRTDSTSPQLLRNASTGALASGINQLGAQAATANFVPQPAGSPNLHLDLADTYEADLSEAAAVTINSLRIASAIQRFQERMNRYGARYIEYLAGLGVRSSDARLQRPEYLGGGSQTIQFSEVVGTSDENLGHLAGHGIGAMRSNRYTRHFEEHGFVISLLYVQPITLYSQGVPRMFNRKTKYDFWQRELQHVGDQEILAKEIYADGTPDDEEIWGYQDRYQEYRRIPSRIAGEFHTTLNTWTAGRIFSERPALNADFVESNPTTRIFQSQATDQMQIMCRHNIHARRLVARNGSSMLK